MKIAFITADWDMNDPPMPGGAGWVRMYEPALALMQHGHECRMGFGVAAHKDGLLYPVDHEGRPREFQADIVVLQRWMHQDAAQLIRRARAEGQVVINDVDDYFMGLHETNMAHRTTAKKFNKVSNREHYKDAIAASSIVTCSTPFITRRYKERVGANTVLLRNAVNVERFTYQPVSDKNDGLVVGWVGAVPWRSNDLETLVPFLDEFLTETHSTFVHHGAVRGAENAGYELAGISEANIGPYKHMTPAPLYPQNIGGFDIGIVPLNMVPFNQAKSAIKGMEYAAAHIPYIAQGTDEYKWFGAGEVVDSPAEWRAALDKLTDSNYRSDKADEAYERVKKEDWTIRWHDWEQLYSNLLSSVKVG